MTELDPAAPAGEHLPLTLGGATLSQAEVGPLALLAPYRGRREALSDTLAARHGLDLPGPNGCSGTGGVRCLWFGRDVALLVGAAPDPALAEAAAVTDQSDGWAVLDLAGPAAGRVLARLTPLDLRAAAFGPGATARTAIAHMAAALTRREAEWFEIMVWRSMAVWAVDEIAAAMLRVAARG